jgi:hypothetical protein
MDSLKDAHYQHSTECGVSMPDEMCVNERCNIIEVVYSGVLTRQDMESTKTKSQQMLAEKWIDRVFIDMTRLESAPSIIDIFEIIASLPPGFKIAVLITPSSPIMREVNFAETVGLNRGTIIKVCLDKNEARQWLGTFTD